MFRKAVDFIRRSKPFPILWTYGVKTDEPTSGFSPVFNPGPAIQFLGPIVPRLLSHEPVILSDCVRIHPRLILPTVPTLRSNATVENGIEAVDSLWSEVPCQGLCQHSLGGLGSGKTNLLAMFETCSSCFSLLTVIGFPRREAVAPVTAITPSPLAVIFGPTC